jgi:hypothetical protein
VPKWELPCQWRHLLIFLCGKLVLSVRQADIKNPWFTSLHLNVTNKCWGYSDPSVANDCCQWHDGVCASVCMMWCATMMPPHRRLYDDNHGYKPRDTVLWDTGEDIVMWNLPIFAACGFHFSTKCRRLVYRFSRNIASRCGRGTLILAHLWCISCTQSVKRV